MLVPEIKEVHLGRAVVRQVFKISKVGTVAGCFVTQGTIERSAKARLIREGREIYKGSIEALKRFKDDVKEVREGFECGIKITQLRRPEDRRRDRGLPDRRHPPDALTGRTVAGGPRPDRPGPARSRAGSDRARVAPMTVATLRLDLRVDDCHAPGTSGGRMQAIMDKLHRHFNVSVAEVGPRRRTRRRPSWPSPPSAGPAARSARPSTGSPTPSPPTPGPSSWATTSPRSDRPMPSHRSLRMAEAIREVVASAILFEVADPRVQRRHRAPRRGLRRPPERDRLRLDHGDRGRAEARDEGPQARRRASSRRRSPPGSRPGSPRS